MLTGVLPVYVGRFARGWPRLSTTDPPPLKAIISSGFLRVKPCCFKKRRAMRRGHKTDERKTGVVDLFRPRVIISMALKRL